MHKRQRNNKTVVGSKRASPLATKTRKRGKSKNKAKNISQKKVPDTTSIVQEKRDKVAHLPANDSADEVDEKYESEEFSVERNAPKDPEEESLDNTSTKKPIFGGASKPFGSSASNKPMFGSKPAFGGNKNKPF